MLHTSTQQLIRKLCELTYAGAINWKEGKGQISVLETEGYVVEIQPDPPSVRLLRGDGQELESADAADLATPWGENEGTFGDHVADMARRANRVARGAETAIAKILSSLSAPPKKQPETDAPTPAQSQQASESAAAIAAVNDDLESQRRKAAEDPPVSHSIADAPAPLISHETETAIDRVLAVQPPVVIDKPREELKAQPAPVTPPVQARVSAPVPVAPRIAPALPMPVAAESAPAPTPPPWPMPTPLPTPKPPTPAPVAVAQPTPQPAPASQVPAAKSGFGAIDAFSRAQPTTPAAQPGQLPEKRKPQPTPVPASGLLMRGFSVQSRQIVEPSTSNDFYKSPTPQAAPAAKPAESLPAPAPAPAPTSVKPESRAESAKPSGKDVYKPWG